MDRRRASITTRMESLVTWLITTRWFGAGSWPKAFVAAGATDQEVAAWIGEHAKKRSRADIIMWNNEERDLRLSDLSPELQEYMEDYIATSVPRHRVVYHWFDVYDLEEERI